LKLPGATAGYVGLLKISGVTDVTLYSLVCLIHCTLLPIAPSTTYLEWDKFCWAKD